MGSADAPDCKAQINKAINDKAINGQHWRRSAGEPFMPPMMNAHRQVFAAENGTRYITSVPLQVGKNE
jgi:hypothetical protein